MACAYSLKKCYEPKDFSVCIYLEAWIKSDNCWVHQDVAVTLIIPARKGLCFEDILEITTAMLCDQDEMV